ncbi:MAG: hypothetical protein IJJ71_07750 [Treponema sp.]|uniref:hypothetical protein n=1 Tax=Treponema sp. TaxID=166 RepID=UPI0025F6F420|nr:hypothetical protein [Treponema sp.]MBR0496051.1 hypothetical protein [Treponema sp.]
MKKIIAIIFAFAFALSTWAENNEPFSVLGFGVNHPWLWEKADLGDSNSSSIGFGMYNVIVGKSGWGFMANASMDFPYHTESDVNGTTVTLTRSDYDSWFNYNFNFGAMYNFYRENNLFLGVAPFFAFGGSLIKKDNFEQGSTILGFGVELNVIYKITERVGFSGGITGQYNFYTIGSQFLNDIKIANLTGRLTQYVVTPYLCFDIYFERK